MASWSEDQAKLDASLAGACPKGRSGRQTKSGASGSELLVAGKHVPDRVGESAGDVDLGDLGAANRRGLPRYYSLFGAAAMVTLELQIQHDWLAPFREPWILLDK